MKSSVRMLEDFKKQKQTNKKHLDAGSLWNLQDLQVIPKYPLHQPLMSTVFSVCNVYLNIYEYNYIDHKTTSSPDKNEPNTGAEHKKQYQLFQIQE